MVFDLISFLIGVLAGGVTGTLAAILHSMEKTADIQERVSSISQRVEEMRAHLTKDDQAKVSQIDDLDRDLEEIHEEIRRMYRGTTR